VTKLGPEFGRIYVSRWTVRQDIGKSSTKASYIALGTPRNRAIVRLSRTNGKIFKRPTVVTTRNMAITSLEVLGSLYIYHKIIIFPNCSLRIFGWGQDRSSTNTKISSAVNGCAIQQERIGKSPATRATSCSANKSLTQTL
jgi:hypothetical protein